MTTTFSSPSKDTPAAGATGGVEMHTALGCHDLLGTMVGVSFDQLLVMQTFITDTSKDPAPLASFVLHEK